MEYFLVIITFTFSGVDVEYLERYPDFELCYERSVTIIPTKPYSVPYCQQLLEV
jgi:hypothetical protein